MSVSFAAESLFLYAMLLSVLLGNLTLEAMMDRRTFIRLAAGSVACSFVGGAIPAGAEELDDNFMPFSPELATEMASLVLMSKS